MATRWAVATGNWSSTATWDGGTLPTSADDVYADGKNVTIDQNVTVLSIRTSQRTGGTNLGTFTINPGVTINATGTGIVTPANSQNHFVLGAGTSGITINGNITAGLNSGQTISGASFTGTLTINGNLSSGGVSNSANTIVTSAGPIVVTGNVYGPNNLSGNNGGGGVITTAAAATVTVTGNVYQGSSGGNSAVPAISTSGLTATVTVTGNVYGATGASGATNAAILTTGAQANVIVTGNLFAGAGPANSTCITNTTSSTLKSISVIGTVTASIGSTTIGSPAILDATTGGSVVTVGGSLVDSAQGDSALCVRRFRCIPTLSTIRQHANNTGYPSGGMITYGSLDYIPNNVPVPADVRSGVVYGNNTFTGSCAVPAAGSVALGVPVDNTTGTAVLTPSAVWDTLTSTMLTPGSIGERLSNCATVQTTGDQIAAANP